MSRTNFKPIFLSPLVFACLFAVNAAADDAQYAGSESCADCHDEQATSFEHSVHGNKADRTSPGGQNGCETCHGPLKAHVKSKGESPVPRVSMTVCLDCHDKGKVALWSGSEHETRNVRCWDCHDAHGTRKNLLRKQTEADTCVACHKDIKGQLEKSSHHPIREGKITCTDCHNPHGTNADHLISANTLNEKCFECHAEKRGPFLWEHSPVTEDCGNCHTPHGSTHDYLLNARTPFLCQRCHSESRHPGTLYAPDSSKPNVGGVYANLSNRGFYRNCLNCHSQIHGSNHPSGETFAR